MGNTIQSFKYALRNLSRSRNFTIVAVLTLALGIAATTSLFSVVNAVLLRDLPYGSPDRLYQVNLINTKSGRLTGATSPLNFLDWRSRSRSFAYLGGYQSGVAFNIKIDDTPERVVGARVSDTLFPALGVQPLIGRGFAPEEDRKGGPNVVILSHRLWTSRFSGDPAVIGKTMTLSGQSFTITGVMPPEFAFPTDGTDVWTPFGGVYEDGGRGNFFVQVVGKLKPGVSADQAQSEMTAICAALEKEYPSENTYLSASLVPLREQITGKIRPVLIALMAGVSLILAIACVNVANLLLVRSTARRREIAIRSALGANRLRIVGQLLVESLVLSLIAGAVGLLAAHWSTSALVAFGPQDIPRLGETRIDGQVLAFTLAVTGLTGLLFGLFPSLYASKLNLIDEIKGTGPRLPIRQAVISGSLVTSEIALAVILLIGAGLLVRSFARVLSLNPGFATEKILTFDVSLPFAKYKSQQTRAFFLEAVDRIAALPGVQAAAASTVLPLSNENNSRYFTVEGRSGNTPQDYTLADHRLVSAGYFEALRIPMRQGRAFTTADFQNSAVPSVIVNEAFVRAFLQGTVAIGKRLKMGETAEAGFPWMTIVGIIGDVKHVSLEAQARPEIYRPFTQATNQENEPKMSFVVRTGQTPQSITGAARREIQSIDAEQPIANVTTMSERLDAAMARRRFTMTLLGIFAGIALTLAFVGVSGVISFGVTQRTREIGIRMALGGRRTDVLKLVIGHGLKLGIVGVGAGCVSAVALTRLMSSLLFGVSASDSLTFVVVAGLMLAMIATYLPARRASTIDPKIALRQE